MNEIEQYNPKEIENSIYEFWERRNYFYASINSQNKKYVIVIPPPNITGFLHMGHALNNTVQDILIRWKRMEGFNTLWVPGTDHAGIATQNVVEKELLKEGISRKEIGREKFLEEVWKWKEKYGTVIISQLKKLGASCDWTKLKFTMDEVLSKAVLTAFIKLYKKGLIYRGKKIINWCPRCITALSDEEVEYEEENGFLYYIKYPILNGTYIEVATTRPETMLGDTAVAVNISDKRYKKLIGEKIKLPFVNREILIIEDEKVDMEFGTGAVKITPSHDPDDFSIGIKHNLEFITVIDSEGRMNENAGEFKGLDRFECREKIIEQLKKNGLLSKVEPYIHRVGHCHRCGTIIEPYLSTQWFVKMKPLAQPAIEVVEKGQIKFYPERWKKIYLQWLYNIKDWCISRQIWWGHRIPVYYCRKCFESPDKNQKSKIKNQNLNDGNFYSDQKGIIVSAIKPEKCPNCNSDEIYQDSDVLDTWFSSWLWPFSVFGWPEKTKELEYFYPTDTLVTAPDILFFWVARMIMAGMEFMGEIPFENIYIHGTVRDNTGKKMSKSLGNVIDPLEIIEKYGADSLRFSLLSVTAFGQDVFLSDSFHLKGRNFVNKIWNASRFIFINLEKNEVKQKIEFDKENKNFTIAEIWILSLLNELIENVTKSLENFKFNEALNSLYEFFWHKFCDWYLEITKIYFKEEKHFLEINLPVLLHVLTNTIKLLHPFIPFVTERIYLEVQKYFNTESESIIISKWPVKDGIFNKDAIDKMEGIIEAIKFIRDIKMRFKIPLKKRINCFYEEDKISLEEKKIISELSGIDKFLPFSLSLPKNTIVRNLKIGKFGLVLEGIVDFSDEIKKLNKEKEKLEINLEKIKNKIENPDFLNKVCSEIREKEKEKLEQLKEKIKKIEEDIKCMQL